MEKQLYGVRNIFTGKYHRENKVIKFWDDKSEAKKKRKELNGVVSVSGRKGKKKKANVDIDLPENMETGWRVSEKKD